MDKLGVEGATLTEETKEVEGETIVEKIYEFGNADEDVATISTNAKKTVVLKVNGNLTINSGVKLTSVKSADGYGGPKGMIIYCTGELINNGTISMTARGAKAEGEDVYLWQNSKKNYEYVPAVGETGSMVSEITRATGRRRRRWSCWSVDMELDLMVHHILEEQVEELIL